MGILELFKVLFVLYKVGSIITTSMECVGLNWSWRKRKLNWTSPRPGTVLFPPFAPQPRGRQHNRRECKKKPPQSGPWPMFAVPAASFSPISTTTRKEEKKNSEASALRTPTMSPVPPSPGTRRPSRPRVYGSHRGLASQVTPLSTIRPDPGWYGSPPTCGSLRSRIRDSPPLISSTCAAVGQIS